MKILVTGAAGFIGSNLVFYLRGKGHTVVGIDNFSHPCGNPIEGVELADVRYSSGLEDWVKNSDIVYHLAAQVNVDKSIAFPHESLDINFSGTTNLLDQCLRYNKTMVFASTSEVYGGHQSVIYEDSPTYAQSPYAVAKLAADKLCGNYHSLYGLRVFRVRCFNTFGPWQSDDLYGAVIPIFVKKILNGEPPVIFGDGEQKRDYIYIDDVVRAYEMIPTVDELVGEPVNVGSGESISINAIADMILEITGRQDLKPVHIRPRLGEVSKLEANIDLIKTYGFKPKVSFRMGLERFITWYKKQHGYTDNR